MGGCHQEAISLLSFEHRQADLASNVAQLE